MCVSGGEDVAGGGDGVVDVGVGVGGGDEAGFEGGGGEVVAGVEHGVEEAVEGGLVALHDFGVVLGNLGAEVEAEHAADGLCAEGDLAGLGGGGQAVAQALGFGAEACVEAGGADQFEGGEPGGDGEGVAGEGARLVHRAEWGDFFHDVATAAEGA